MSQWVCENDRYSQDSFTVESADDFIDIVRECFGDLHDYRDPQLRWGRDRDGVEVYRDEHDEVVLRAVDDECEECTRCGYILTDNETAKGWPIADGADYVCPECYGEEAFCRCGEVLRGDEESDQCEECAR